jgi:hypothetical protein
VALLGLHGALMPGQILRDTFRFDEFELDAASYELRRSGRLVRLERQPMDLLILLVERRGQLVPRAEIIDRLWGKDVFVDVETGVHTAIPRSVRRCGIRPTARNSSRRSPAGDTASLQTYRWRRPHPRRTPLMPSFLKRCLHSTRDPIDSCRSLHGPSRECSPSRR